MAGAQTIVIPYNANANPRCAGGQVSARMGCVIGWSPPPKAPCSTRKKSSIPRLGAIPHKKELSVKKMMQVKKKRLRPSQSTKKPLIGSTTAFETKYVVNTHVLSSLLA